MSDTEAPSIAAGFTRKPRLTAKIGKVSVTLTAIPTEKHEAKPNRKVDADTPVSQGQWGAMVGAFDNFNRELFGGTLPPVMLNFSRHANCYGFFAPNRWYDAKGDSEMVTVTHEISLNPSHLRSRDLRATYSTLVHEMVHLWQEDQGRKKSKRGYHNGEWADKMESVGLMPTSTGVPGGARIGYKVTHMVIDGGPYDQAFESLPDEFKLPWLCEEPAKAEAKPRKKSKIKYECPECEDTRAWAKPGAKIMCGDCEVPLVAEEDEDEEDDEEAAADTIASRLEYADGGR